MVKKNDHIARVMKYPGLARFVYWLLALLLLLLIIGSLVNSEVVQILGTALIPFTLMLWGISILLEGKLYYSRGSKRRMIKGRGHLIIGILGVVLGIVLLAFFLAMLLA